MKPLLGAVLTIAFALGTIGFLQTATSGGTSYEELLARVRPAADARIRYGGDTDQFGDLYLPRQRGPHATVVLIHGGCWQAALPGVELMALMADALRLHGFAVWNVEISPARSVRRRIPRNVSRHRRRSTL